MNTQETKDKALHEIFSRIDSSPLPDRLNTRIMQKVRRAQKKKELRNILIVFSVSAVMLGLSFYVLVHYLSFDPAKIFGTPLKQFFSLSFPKISAFTALLIPVLFLLWADYGFRKRYR